MSDFLYGWKAIEDFLQMTRKTIVALRYPIRKQEHGRFVRAEKDALMRHARLLASGIIPVITRAGNRRPLVRKPQPRRKGKG